MVKLFLRFTTSATATSSSASHPTIYLPSVKPKNDGVKNLKTLQSNRFCIANVFVSILLPSILIIWQ